MTRDTSAKAGRLHTYIIRKAQSSDIAAVEQLYSDVLEAQERGVNYTNWQRGLYPTRADAERALEEGTLYVAQAAGPETGLERAPETGPDAGETAGSEEIAGFIAGAAILNHDQPAEYGGLKWSVEAEGNEVLVIHTLCISPHFRNAGLGRKFVEFAEEQARSLGCRTVRFDTYEGNTPATALYTKLGYTIVGTAEFHFQKLIWETLRCFDKVIR